MWALAALIVWMAAHVMLGWMRQAQEEWEWDFGRVRQIMLGGAAFGTALSVATPLGLAGEALSFPIGYHPWAAAALWAGAVVLVTLLALVPVWREEGVSAAAAGLMMGLLMTGLQVAWISIVGFRPGIRWDTVFIAAAATISGAGTSTAMAIAFPFGDRAGRYSYSWRIAAAGLIGLSFLAGYALLLFAADLPVQIGSVYRHALPGSVIALGGGGLLPIVLLLMIMDLETRRRQRRRLMRARLHGHAAPDGESARAPMNLQPERYRSRYSAPPPPPTPVAPGPPAPHADAAPELPPPTHPPSTAQS